MGELHTLFERAIVDSRDACGFTCRSEVFGCRRPVHWRSWSIKRGGTSSECELLCFLGFVETCNVSVPCSVARKRGARVSGELFEQRMDWMNSSGTTHRPVTFAKLPVCTWVLKNRTCNRPRAQGLGILSSYTCETIKWLMLKSSLICCIGRSASMLPSTNLSIDPDSGWVLHSRASSRTG